jgi:uridine kinase
MSPNCEKELNIEQKDGVRPVECVLADVICRYFKDSTDPCLIAVGGAGGTGKSTFSKKLSAVLKEASVLRLDDYKTCRYFRKDRGIFGAHPEANEMDLISEHLAMIKSGLVIDKPVYCSDAGRATKTEKYSPARFNIVEGEVATYKEFADIIDFHIFIDAHLDTQLQTRLNRDILQRGYTKEKAMATFVGSNINEFKKYGEGTKAWADVILFCDQDYSLTIQGQVSSLHERFL